MSQKEYFQLQAFFANTSARDDIPAAKGQYELEYDEQQAIWQEATKNIRAQRTAVLDEVRAKAEAHYVSRFLDNTRASLSKPEDLEPVLVAGNFDSARADAEVLRGGLQYVYDYFVANGNAEDAVKMAAEGQATIVRVFAALDGKNQEAAIAAARDTAKNCKACHEVYKP